MTYNLNHLNNKTTWNKHHVCNHSSRTMSSSTVGAASRCYIHTRDRTAVQSSSSTTPISHHRSRLSPPEVSPEALAWHQTVHWYWHDTSSATHPSVTLSTAMLVRLPRCSSTKPSGAQRVPTSTPTLATYGAPREVDGASVCMCVWRRAMTLFDIYVHNCCASFWLCGVIPQRSLSVRVPCLPDNTGCLEHQGAAHWSSHKW